MTNAINVINFVDGAKCFVSGRLHSTNEFLDKLGMSFSDIDSFRLQPLSEEYQLEMVKKYKNHINNGDKIEELFTQLKPLTKRVFETPLLMGSYISLAVGEAFDAARVNSVVGLYDEIIKVFKDEMERRLSVRNVKNKRTVAKQLLDELSKFSLKKFNSSKYFISENDFDILVDKCQALNSVKNLDINFEDIFSSILSPRYDSRMRLEQYEFPHLSTQEFLASLVIVNILQQDLDTNGSVTSVTKLLYTGDNIMSWRLYLIHV